MNKKPRKRKKAAQTQPKPNSIGPKPYLIIETKPLTTGPEPITYGGKTVTIIDTVIE